MHIEVGSARYKLVLIPYLANTAEMIALPASLVGLMLCASQSDNASWMACLTSSDTESEISVMNKAA